MFNPRYFVIALMALSSCIGNDRERVLNAYFEAHNSNQVDLLLSFCHPDIVFDLENTWTKQGLDEMRSLAIWDSTLNSQLQLEILGIRSDSVYCNVIEENDWFKSAGISRLVHDSVLFIVTRGKIRRIEVRPSPTTTQEILSVMGSLVEWSEQNRDPAIYRLMSGGQFIYSSEAALEWLELLDRWNSSRDTQ